MLKLPEIKIGVKNHADLTNNHHSVCFNASYHSCTMSQTIDLIKDYEISRKILHDPKYEFDIDVIEWHIMQGPCRYELKVSFRDENNRVIQEVECDSKFSNEFENGTWAKCHRTVTICGIRKLRFITFYHGATCNEPVPTREDNVQGNYYPGFGLISVRCNVPLEIALTYSFYFLFYKLNFSCN